jgi:hypothetical protein
MGVFRSALLALAACLAPASAGAIELSLPGERELFIHGFYDTRVSLTGDGAFPGGDGFSQFRHVLQLEAEFLAFPEGFGPVDSLLLWTRLGASYDCLYQRACGLSSRADSFGGARREAVHLPPTFGRGARPAAPRIGGLHGRPILALPELTGLEARREFNPRGRLRPCIDPLGSDWSRANPAPYGGLCTLNEQSPLSGPHHGLQGSRELPFYSFARVHAGAFALPARFSLLRVARSRIGEQRYGELLSLLLPDPGGEIAGGLSASRESLRRGLLRAGERGAAGALRVGSFDEAIPELLATRQDPSLFRALALASEPELLRSSWGMGRVAGSNVAFTPALALEIRPTGYFRSAALDLVSELAEGVSTGLPPGAEILPESFRAFAGADNPFVPQAEFERGALPMFVGPDGVAGSEDDLPSSRTGVFGLDEPIPEGSRFRDRVQFRYSRVGKVLVDGEPLELYGVLEPLQLRRRACEFLTHRPAGAGERPCALEVAGVESQAELERVGCRLAADQWGYQRVMGVNADGHCIALNVTEIADRGGVDPRVLVALGERRFRPSDASLEPIDLTDFRLHAENGSSLPARPRPVGNGLVFDTPGAARFRRDHRRSVANLGLGADEDSLRWSHGASDDEREFREGFVEFEAAERQLTARVGKLIAVWGKTDWFRNVDRLNPLDFSGGPLQPLEESRIGLWGAQLWLQPESWLSLGRFEDLRLEVALLVDDFEPDDRGRCGEPGALPTACLLQTSALMSGFTGVGVIGQTSPYRDHAWLERVDWGVRLEGRFDRFSFAVSDFWGWDDVPLLRSVHVYGRGVDSLTGAPLRVGGTRCRWRSAAGGSTDVRAESVGPNGIAGDDDDAIPTSGDCLLWDAPRAPGGAQPLRAEDAIAASHGVNQALFHLLCTLSFSGDQGFCDFDSLNSPQRFGKLMAVLGGGPLEEFAFPELGLDRIRVRGTSGAWDARARERDLLDFELVETGPARFRPLNEFGGAGVDIYAGAGLSPAERESVGLGGAALRPLGLGALTLEQAALLGCGPAYGSPCDARERDDYTGDGLAGTSAPLGGRSGSLLLRARLESGALRAQHVGMSQAEFDALSPLARRSVIALDQGTIGASLARTASQIGGGIDLLNADASVLLQESSVLKAWAPGMFVGTQRSRRGLEWLPGINTQDDGTPENDYRRGRFRLPGEAEPLSAERALALGQTRRDRLSAAWSANLIDGWIEPMPWKLDPHWARKGVVLYQADPVHPFGDPRAWSLPADDPERVRKLIGSTSNRFNLLPDGTPYGEYCGTLSQVPGFAHPFARGCSGLEILSANLERLSIGSAIVGGDREFDPPESIAELRAWIAHRSRIRPEAAASGDPISGGDGIFARNFWADLVLSDSLEGGPGENDLQDVLAVRGVAAAVGKGTFVSPLRSEDLARPESERVARRREFYRSYDPASCPPSTRACHLKLSLESSADSGLGQGGVELVAALPISYAVDEVRGDGVRGRPVRVNLLKLELERPLELARLFAGERIFDPDSGKFVAMNAVQRAKLLGEGSGLAGAYQDLDGDQLPDLDRDLDNVWDGQDDFTPGPITDDDVLCGSGIPGDVLQEALQFEPHRRSERPGTAKFQAAFADGLPPRSPVFCTQSLLGSARARMPLRRAGGDGRYGRMQFAWHGGQQVALDFQKTNVLGMALDFSEDVLRASWNLEFSYTRDRAFNDASDSDLVSHSDELIGSIAFDRSLFIHALNRGASVLFNSQLFLRLLTDWRSGFELHTPAALSSAVTFSLQTSYLQGRAEPSATLIWLPQESQGGLLAELRYAWTDRITTILGVSHVLGGPAMAPGLYEPIAPGFDSPDDLEQTAWSRGLTPLLERDELWLRFRYAW